MCQQQQQRLVWGDTLMIVVKKHPWCSNAHSAQWAAAVRKMTARDKLNIFAAPRGAHWLTLKGLLKSGDGDGDGGDSFFCPKLLRLSAIQDLIAALII